MGEPQIDTAISLLSNEIAPLKKYCEDVIVEKITRNLIENTLTLLTKERRESLMKLLPLNLSLDLSVPIIFDEIYWMRKCIAEKWSYVHYWINNCSWRDTFICHYVEASVDNFLAKKLMLGELLNALEVFQKYLKRIKINGYKGNLAKDDKDLSQAVSTPFEETVRKLFELFPYLEEVYLNIAPAKYASCNEAEEYISRTNLIKSIFYLENLKKLTIIGYSLDNKQISSLAECKFKSLSHLNVSCNLLSDTSCECIANLLKSSKIERLVLSNNCIGAKGSQQLLSGIKENQTLISLDLSKNYIDDEGGVVLAESLKTNTVLQKLDISFNKLGYNSGMAINQVIEINKNLIYLNISGNIMGQKIGKVLMETVTTNSSLQYFGVEFCEFEEQDEDAIFMKILNNSNETDSGLFL